MRVSLRRFGDHFTRIHERPWIYALSFAVPLLVIAGFYIVRKPELSVFVFYFLYGDAIWRHRMREIERDGARKKKEIDERFDRRIRVLAVAQADAAYRKRLDAEIAKWGNEAIDSFPLPSGGN